MDTLKFLEKMATSVHHQSDLNDLINHQSMEVAIAYKTNNNDALINCFDDIEYVSNPTEVVQF